MAIWYNYFTVFKSAFCQSPLHPRCSLQFILWSRLRVLIQHNKPESLEQGGHLHHISLFFFLAYVALEIHCVQVTCHLCLHKQACFLCVVSSCPTSAWTRIIIKITVTVWIDMKAAVNSKVSFIPPRSAGKTIKEMHTVTITVHFHRCIGNINIHI